MDWDKEKETAFEQIAATIAHELKNPLSLVRANIDLLELRDNEKDMNSRNYTVMRRELERIQEMVMELLQLFGQPQQEMAKVDLNHILVQVVENYQISWENQVEVNFRNEDRALYVLGNEKSLAILFSNILKNAVEASQERVKITIQVKQEQDQAIVIIRDNGPGLPKEAEDRAFEEFFTTKEKGTGLGLVICKQIINWHNGTFTLANHSEGGCAARVSLPVFCV